MVKGSLSAERGESTQLRTKEHRHKRLGFSEVKHFGQLSKDKYQGKTKT